MSANAMTENGLGSVHLSYLNVMFGCFGSLKDNHNTLLLINEGHFICLEIW